MENFYSLFPHVRESFGNRAKASWLRRLFCIVQSWKCRHRQQNIPVLPMSIRPIELLGSSQSLAQSFRIRQTTLIQVNSPKRDNNICIVNKPVMLNKCANFILRRTKKKIKAVIYWPLHSVCQVWQLAHYRPILFGYTFESKEAGKLCLTSDDCWAPWLKWKFVCVCKMNNPCHAHASKCCSFIEVTQCWRLISCENNLLNWVASNKKGNFLKNIGKNSFHRREMKLI